MQAFRRKAAFRFVLGFVVAAFAGSTTAFAQSRFRPPPAYVQLGAPDQAEGSRVLAEFRSLGIAGAFALDFNLRVMPRRGPERTLNGRMFGSRDSGENVSRIRFQDPGPLQPRALLLRGGADGGIWTLDPNARESRRMTEAEMFSPIADTELTAFDLQMPFLQWSDAVYEGLAKLRGRPAHQFIVYPPPAVAAAKPELAGVRFHLDAQFNGLVQAEQIGESGKALKTISVLELKKTQDQWIVTSVDLRNDVTRDKTRFRVTAAALGVTLPLIIFQPAHLALTDPEIPRERFESFR